jgi:hypothetical protein
MNRKSLTVPLHNGVIQYSEDRTFFGERRIYAEFIYSSSNYESRINLFPYVIQMMDRSTEDIIDHLIKVIPTL